MISQPEPFQEMINHKFTFLEKISKKFPVGLGEHISWEANSIYGEVLFHTLNEIFEKTREKYGLEQGGIFYDLGSGIGKAVVSAAILHDFSTCIGIEILPELYNLSLCLQQKYLKHKNKYTYLRDSTNDVRFINDDMFNYNWTDATCFFANSTCFDEDLIKKISNYPVKSGTVCISTTKRMLKSSWQLLETCHKDMSWGKATVYIHKKL